MINNNFSGNNFFCDSHSETLTVFFIYKANTLNGFQIPKLGAVTFHGNKRI